MKNKVIKSLNYFLLALIGVGSTHWGSAVQIGDSQQEVADTAGADEIVEGLQPTSGEVQLFLKNRKNIGGSID